MIVNVLDLVGQHHEPAIDFIQITTLELVAELLATQTECMTPGMLTQNQLRVRNADRTRRHDFVRQRVLQHAVLMDTSLMGKCVASDDGFVGLDRDSCDLLEHLTRRIKLFCNDLRVISVMVTAYAKRHYDLFQRSIA